MADWTVRSSALHFITIKKQLVTIDQILKLLICHQDSETIREFFKYPICCWGRGSGSGRTWTLATPGQKLLRLAGEANGRRPEDCHLELWWGRFRHRAWKLRAWRESSLFSRSERLRERNQKTDSTSRAKEHPINTPKVDFFQSCRKQNPLTQLPSRDSIGIIWKKKGKNTWNRDCGKLQNKGHGWHITRLEMSLWTKTNIIFTEI